MLNKKIQKLNMQLISLETQREIARNSVLDIESMIRTVEKTIDNLEFQPLPAEDELDKAFKKTI